jgi:hypothetical protein
LGDSADSIIFFTFLLVSVKNNFLYIVRKVLWVTQLVSLEKLHLMIWVVKPL